MLLKFQQGGGKAEYVNLRPGGLRPSLCISMGPPGFKVKSDVLIRGEMARIVAVSECGFQAPALEGLATC